MPALRLWAWRYARRKIKARLTPMRSGLSDVQPEDYAVSGEVVTYKGRGYLLFELMGLLCLVVIAMFFTIQGNPYGIAVCWAGSAGVGFLASRVCYRAELRPDGPLVISQLLRRRIVSLGDVQSVVHDEKGRGLQDTRWIIRLARGAIYLDDNTEADRLIAALRLRRPTIEFLAN
jgi:hypothetical protein